MTASDDRVGRQPVAGGLFVVVGESSGFWFAPDSPAPPIDRAWRLADGRVVTIILPRDQDAMALVWVKVRGVWLIDEQAWIVAAGTPEAA